MNIMWFRQDLRLADNPALCKAVSAGEVLAIYILDEINAGEHRQGAASRVWLYHALQDLNASLSGHLQLFQGDAKQILLQLCRKFDIEGVYWNRAYEPWRIQRDRKIKQMLRAEHIDVHSENASLLWEPWTVLKKDATPYKVFTPYYRRGCLAATAPRLPIDAPQNISFSEITLEGCCQLEDLPLMPKKPWGAALAAQWQMTEQAAHAQLDAFLNHSVNRYKQGRDFPAQAHTSRLSPYLHFGQISPHQVWARSQYYEPTQDLDCFQSELAWREFSYSLLYHFPRMVETNLNKKFDVFPWLWDEQGVHVKAWQLGQTGYPIVDAGMRELWQTGFMHNRVRMIVASFLVKNLLQHWRIGEAWFWDCLFDADLASNTASWQWVAGCGADAAPYFRIFNPVSQGEKFDKHGEYTRRFVPELAALPDKYLHQPWTAPEEVLAEARVTLGSSYPKPIVGLKSSRQRALEAFQMLKTILDDQSSQAAQA